MGAARPCSRFRRASPPFALDHETAKSKEITLAEVYDGDKFERGKVELWYDYDQGDGWEHQIAFLGKADPNLRKTMMIPAKVEAVCLGGEGHPCAEDCGGSYGWETLKEVFKTKEDPEDRREWYKSWCANGEDKDLDPYKWDVLDVNDILGDLKQKDLLRGKANRSGWEWGPLDDEESQ